MHAFVRNLITEWRRLELPFSDGTVVMAVSGGADSVSLLLGIHELRQMRKLDLRLVAAHFNHRLRGFESDADEEFVRRLTSERGIELAAGSTEIHQTGNLEQNARNARYEFLTRTAGNLNAFAVLTGHTVNDQAETFLLNLIRGSGVEGLAGMKSVRILEKENGSREEVETSESDTRNVSPLLLIRPLMSWAKRKDTEAYCHDSGIEYRFDTMNEDTAFKRVQIRKILLPLLEDMNPKIIETLANTAALMQQVPGLQDEETELIGRETLKLADLKLMPKAELYSTLRGWLRVRRGSTRRLQLNHIQAIERLIFSEKSGRMVELPNGERVVRSDGELSFEKIEVEN